jgi:transposase
VEEANWMIVIGLDVHKHSVTAVAVDEAGRPLDESLIPVGSDDLLSWAAGLGSERLWAVEDCRQLTRWLERQLLGVGEQLVRVPPKLTVPERRAGRSRGKSDPIDALAIARAALREPDLCRPRPDERVYREIKLLVDHRDDVVDQRRRAQQRLRWHLHALDPTFVVPLRRLDRPLHLERVSRWLARREPELQVQLARELVASCRKLNRAVTELDQQLERRVVETAPALLDLPGCAAVTAAKLLAEIGPIQRFRSDAQLARHGGVAPLEASSGRTQRHRLDRGGNRQLNAALHRIAITQARIHPGARAYLERKKGRRQKPPRSDPLPQTPTRTRRLQHPQNEPRLDIGATVRVAWSVCQAPYGPVDSISRSCSSEVVPRPAQAAGRCRGAWQSDGRGEDAVLHGIDSRRLYRRREQLAGVAVRSRALRRRRLVRAFLRRDRRDGNGRHDLRMGRGSRTSTR